MFKLQPNPTFKAKVAFPTPGNTAKFTAEFKYFTPEAWGEFISEHGDKPVNEILPLIMTGWHDVDTDFSAPALNDMLTKYSAASQALFGKFLAELSGAPRGN